MKRLHTTLTTYYQAPQLLRLMFVQVDCYTVWKSPLAEEKAGIRILKKKESVFGTHFYIWKKWKRRMEKSNKDSQTNRLLFTLRRISKSSKCWDQLWLSISPLLPRAQTKDSCVFRMTMDTRIQLLTSTFSLSALQLFWLFSVLPLHGDFLFIYLIFFYFYSS